MTSVVAIQPGEIRPVLPVARSIHNPIMTMTQEPTPPQAVKHEDDAERGRRRSRSREKDSKARNDPDHDEDADGDIELRNDNSSNDDDGPARKRRRSRKGLDKKFECPHDGCGKSYSRAEHL